MLIKEDQDIIKGYFEDSSNLKGGHADSVVFPEDINILSEFVKEANRKQIPITVSGGGTGTAMCYCVSFKMFGMFGNM